MCARLANERREIEFQPINAQLIALPGKYKKMADESYLFYKMLPNKSIKKARSGVLLTNDKSLYH